MLNFQSFLTGFCLLCSGYVMAMPEELLNTRTSDKILPLFEKTLNLNPDEALVEIKGELSQTGIAVLDDIWNRRQDVRAGACNQSQNNCRTLSVFEGKTKNNPIVILVGFTGYRHMYVEQVYDLVQAGYGPIYVGDFAGGGENFAPDRKAGQSAPTVEKFISSYNKKVKAGFEQTIQNASGKIAGQVESILNRLPVGVGHLNSVNEYVDDINFIAGYASKQHPEHKISIVSLSASGLGMAFALAQDSAKYPWLKRVDRIVLESPMIQIKIQNDFVFPTIVGWIGKNFLGATRVASPESSMPEYARKALGIYDPTNIISHSPNRLSLTDNLRVWNGYETAGATFGWGNVVLDADYVIRSQTIGTRRINHVMPQIKKTLVQNSITLITVSSEADALVNNEATKDFMNTLGELGARQLHVCLFKTAKHVIDQESDKYREPYLELIADQLNKKVNPVYGVEPRNELLKCSTVAE